MFPKKGNKMMLLVNNNSKKVINQNVMTESINIKTFSTAAKY